MIREQRAFLLVIAVFETECCSDPSRQFGKRLCPDFNQPSWPRTNLEGTAYCMEGQDSQRNSAHQPSDRDRLPLSSMTELVLHCAVLNSARVACRDGEFAKLEGCRNQCVQYCLCIACASCDVLLEAAHIGRRFCDTTAAVLFAPTKTAARSLDRRKHVSSVLCCSSDSPEHSLVYVYRTQMYALANFTTVFSFFYFSGFPLSEGLFSWHRNRHLPPLYRKRIRATYSLFSVTVTRRPNLVVHALFL